MPGANRYTVQRSADGYDRLRVGMTPSDRPNEWAPSSTMHFYAHDVPTPGTAQFSVQYRVRDGTNMECEQNCVAIDMPLGAWVEKFTFFAYPGRPGGKPLAGPGVAWWTTPRAVLRGNESNMVFVSPNEVPTQVPGARGGARAAARHRAPGGVRVRRFIQGGSDVRPTHVLGTSTEAKSGERRRLLC